MEDHDFQEKEKTLGNFKEIDDVERESVEASSKEQFLFFLRKPMGRLMRFSEGASAVHYNSDVNELYGGVVLGSHLQVCLDGFFMEVEVSCASTSEVGLSVGVTTRDGLRT